MRWSINSAIVVLSLLCKGAFAQNKPNYYFIEGKWKLVNYFPVKLTNDTLDKQFTYEGLQLVEIKNGYGFFNITSNTIKAKYKIIDFSPEKSTIQFHNKLIGNKSLYYVDADSLVLGDFGVQGSNVYYFLNCYKRNDTVFKDFSRMKTQLLKQWHACYNIKEKAFPDTIKLSSNDLKPENCMDSNCSTHSFWFKKNKWDKFELQITLHETSCDTSFIQEHLLTAGHYSLTLNADLTITIFDSSSDFSIRYMPIFHNAELLLVRQK